MIQTCTICGSSLATGFAGRHYTTFMVLSVFNSSGIQLTHAETLDVIATLTDGMEMWQADRDLRFISKQQLRWPYFRRHSLAA
ncbi:MAG: hypothetical protein ACOX3S_15395 [Anaerolineae bacterium]